MSRAVVIGGSLAGLTTALALSRAGWQVDVVERDPMPDGSNAHEVFRQYPRPAVPQSGHRHNFFSLITVTLRARGPDVLERLFDFGVRPLMLRDFPPP